MRGIKLFLGFLLLLAGPSLAMAQEAPPDNDADLFRVADIAVDVTADSAAAARDKGLVEAEKAAFAQMVQRLGTQSAPTKTPDETALANMVQAFDIQSENPRAGRYIGTLTIQFKPAMVRNFLHKTGTSFSEIRSRPLVVLPVVTQPGRTVLWEDRTAWRTAWENAAPSSALVPLLVPPGDLDDIATLSGADAVGGKTPALATLATKYQAGGVIVATLDADLNAPLAGQSWKVTLRHFDETGREDGTPQTLTLPPVTDAKTASAALAAGVKEARHDLESGWKQTSKNLEGPATTLRVTAIVPTLAAWADLRTKMGRVPAIARTNVTALTRGRVDAEIQFHGDIPGLQAALGEQNILLEQTPMGWSLRDK